MSRSIFALPLALALATLLAACGDGPVAATAALSGGTTPTRVAVAATGAVPTRPATSVATPSGGARTPATDAPTGPTAKVGETAIGKAYRVTLHEVRDPAILSGFAPLPPGPGKRHVAFDVSLKNTAAQAAEYKGGDFKLRPDLVVDPYFIVGGPQPVLGGGTLAPGGTKRGWVAFEVPEDFPLTTLVYEPVLTAGVSPRASGDRVAFDLRK